MVLEIVKYGDPVLRAKGRLADPKTEGLRELAEDMIDTMYAARGLGLAAQQVGVPLQMTVLDVAQVQNDRPSSMIVDGKLVDINDWTPLVLLNPKVELGDERDVASEGCSSFPEINGDVPRSKRIKVQAQLLDGRTIHFEAAGLLSRAVQHEVDHLQGVLFTDRMNSATKASLAGRMKRLQKEGIAEARPVSENPRKAKQQPAVKRPGGRTRGEDEDL